MKCLGIQVCFATAPDFIDFLVLGGMITEHPRCILSCHKPNLFDAQQRSPAQLRLKEPLASVGAVRHSTVQFLQLVPRGPHLGKDNP